MGTQPHNEHVRNSQAFCSFHMSSGTCYTCCKLDIVSIQNLLGSAMNILTMDKQGINNQQGQIINSVRNSFLQKLENCSGLLNQVLISFCSLYAISLSHSEIFQWNNITCRVTKTCKTLTLYLIMLL